MIHETNIKDMCGQIDSVIVLLLGDHDQTADTNRSELM